MAESHDVRAPGKQQNNSDAIERPDLCAEAVREQLERICESRGFASAESLRRFLSFIVEKTLQGQGTQLKEYLIGVDVFDRGEKFDPRLDSIVRVQGSKLRSKLREYYELSGIGDPIRIDLPKGSYAPVFRSNETRLEVSPISVAPAVSVPARTLRQWRIALAALLAIAAGTGIYIATVQPRNATTPRTLVRLTYDAGLAIDPTISPDGKLLAYASDRAGGSNLDIWVQPINGGTPLRLTRFSGDARDPAFSPDGTQLAFTANQEDGGIYLISVFGGEARKIAPRGRRPRFSPDGNRITYWVGTDVYGEIHVASVSGAGNYRLRPDFNHATFPIWSPDGKYILFFGNNSNETFDVDWWLTDVEGKSLKRTGLWKVIVHDHHLELDIRLFGDWIWSQKYLVFSARQGDSVNLWRIPVSLNSGAPTGTLERVTFGAGQDVLPSIAADGRLVFANIRDNVQVWSIPVRGERAVTAGELRLLTSDAAADAWPHISNDGKKLVFASKRGGDWRIWIKDLKSGQETCLTPAPAKGIVPTISPDGTKVAYGPPFSGKGQSVGLYVVDSQGGGVVRICEHCGYPSSWSHDQRKLFYALSPLGNPGWLDVGTGEAHPFLKDGSYIIWDAQFSPDDRWVAFAALEHRNYNLFVTPFVKRGPIGSSSWLPVTRGPQTDRNPAWSLDGQVLYFLSDRDTFPCVWAVRLDRNKRPNGEAFPVIHFHSARRSPANVIQNQFRLSVSEDKLSFNLGELTGDIWMSKL